MNGDGLRRTQETSTTQPSGIDTDPAIIHAVRGTNGQPRATASQSHSPTSESPLVTRDIEAIPTTEASVLFAQAKELYQNPNTYKEALSTIGLAWQKAFGTERQELWQTFHQWCTVAPSEYNPDTDDNLDRDPAFKSLLEIFRHNLSLKSSESSRKPYPPEIAGEKLTNILPKPAPQLTATEIQFNEGLALYFNHMTPKSFYTGFINMYKAAQEPGVSQVQMLAIINTLDADRQVITNACMNQSIKTKYVLNILQQLTQSETIHPFAQAKVILTLLLHSIKNNGKKQQYYTQLLKKLNLTEAQWFTLASIIQDDLSKPLNTKKAQSKRKGKGWKKDKLSKADAALAAFNKSIDPRKELLIFCYEKCHALSPTKQCYIDHLIRAEDGNPSAQFIHRLKIFKRTKYTGDGSCRLLVNDHVSFTEISSLLNKFSELSHNSWTHRNYSKFITEEILATIANPHKTHKRHPLFKDIALEQYKKILFSIVTTLIKNYPHQGLYYFILSQLLTKKDLRPAEFNSINRDALDLIIYYINHTGATREFPSITCCQDAVLAINKFALVTPDYPTVGDLEEQSFFTLQFMLNTLKAVDLDKHLSNEDATAEKFLRGLIRKLAHNLTPPAPSEGPSAQDDADLESTEILESTDEAFVSTEELDTTDEDS